MGDQYVKNPKDAVARGKVPEVGPRGAVRYRPTGSSMRNPMARIPTPNNPMRVPNVKPNPKQAPIFIGEIANQIGIFETGGRYIAYHLNTGYSLRVIKFLQQELQHGVNIHDAILDAENIE